MPIAAAQADNAAVQEQAEQELLAARQAEHAELAGRLPGFFGPEPADLRRTEPVPF
jgi:hypothetical protein